MIKKKSVKSRGKLKLSQYFQEFTKGETVAIVRELSAEPKFPIRIQGRCGIVTGMKGNSYTVDVKDHGTLKTYVLKPVHLKRIKS